MKICAYVESMGHGRDRGNSEAPSGQQLVDFESAITEGVTHRNYVNIRVYITNLYR